MLMIKLACLLPGFTNKLLFKQNMKSFLSLYSFYYELLMFPFIITIVFAYVYASVVPYISVVIVSINIVCAIFIDQVKSEKLLIFFPSRHLQLLLLLLKKKKINQRWKVLKEFLSHAETSRAQKFYQDSIRCLEKYTNCLYQKSNR